MDTKWVFSRATKTITDSNVATKKDLPLRIPASPRVMDC